MDQHVVFIFFLIFTGGALLASLALFGRQPLLVAYIALGALMGPFGLGWVSDVDLIAQISSIGIVFLLFLLGLDMQPQSLLNVLKQVAHITLISSLLFAFIGFGIAYSFNFTLIECTIIGAAMMFSSTIIGIKLLPTTALHHKHSGELMVGMLLMQDFLAIAVLLVLLSASSSENGMSSLAISIVALPALVACSMFLVRYLLQPLFTLSLIHI